MSDIQQDVYPKDYLLPPKTIYSVDIKIMELVLFKYVRVLVLLLGEEKQVIDTKQFVIQGEAYNNWASDDNYLIDLILRELLLVKKPEKIDI